MNFQESSIKYNSDIVYHVNILEIFDSIKVVSFGVRPYLLLVNEISGNVRIWHSFFG